MNDLDFAVEANLRSIVVDPESKEIYIEIFSPGGGLKTTLLAKGVDEFLINEMRLNNIIDRITVTSGADLDGPECVRRLLFLMYGDVSIDVSGSEIQKRLDVARTGKFSLLEIEPVYGASVLILAEEFQLLR